MLWLYAPGTHVWNMHLSWHLQENWLRCSVTAKRSVAPFPLWFDGFSFPWTLPGCPAAPSEKQRRMVAQKEIAVNSD